ncbi:MAG: peptidylprolyl isomerase [Holophagales bacterium]|nr:peptidylprolyl isomerase [Holophagales bacterium]
MIRRLPETASADRPLPRRRPSVATLGLVVWLSMAPGAAQQADGGTPSLDRAEATFRAAVSQRELDSWIEHGSAAGEATSREAALEQLILVRSLAAEALRLRLDRRPATRVELEAAEGQIAIQALRRHVAASISVLDEEVEAKYRAIADTYTLPRRVRLRNLFKRFPVGGSRADKAALRERMEALRREVLAGADFAALAEAESDSRTRLRGGLIGNVRAGVLRPAIDRVAMALEGGEVSEVLEEPEGLTLLYCEAVLDAVHRSADELREIARDLVEKQAWQRSWAAMEAHLLESAAAEWSWGVLGQGSGRAGSRRGDDAVLVRYLGARLTVVDALALTVPRVSFSDGAPETAANRLADLDRDRIRRRIEHFLRSRMAVRELAVLGIGSDALAEDMLWTRRRLLAAKAIAEHVALRLGPLREADVEAFFRAHPKLFERPAHYDLGLIVLPFEPADPRPAHDLGLRLVHDLESGATTFGDLARAHSEDPSAGDGGELTLPRPSLSRRLGMDGLRAVLRLQPGERSRWVQDDERSRFLLIELRAVEPSRPSTFDEARRRARQLLGQRRAEKLEEEVTAEWWQRLDVRSPEDPALGLGIDP